ncbi:uracil-5-carboxylate decarboxylase [Niveomyces insectorum RCEF 264]|uniref:Uracil-5-carboxylate decarboxylase n=1 Tax=Niveomyces insectorum RCEF 264 TaxID=1081102 RepID=A0A167Y9H6_9HYPO|nr:uracil-5-carboxylate decarboxylase [Niveomyces insectorum RCEF 264]
MAAPPKTPVVDIHTHMYPPEYIKLLESRSSIPMVRSFPGADDPRLLLLSTEMDSVRPAETTLADGDTRGTEKDTPGAAAHLPGRPLTRHYSSVAQKLHFMDTHGIDVSVVSLANPWLDFVDSDQAGPFAETVNTGFAALCAQPPAAGRLYFFAALPVTAPRPVLLAAIARLWRQAQTRRSIWAVLHEQVYLDAVVYADVGLQAALAAAGRQRHEQDGGGGSSSSASAGTGTGTGTERLLFGTDHPFFPPVEDGADDDGVWDSVTLNTEAVAQVLGTGTEAAAAVMGGNAVRVLGLYEGEAEKAARAHALAQQTA